PTPNGRIAVTVAAPPPLPIQHHHPKTPSSGGGREDCWSEGATAVLIAAWGERYLELSRGNLKQKHWKDVADIVSSRGDYTKTPKTDIQCKNRIDTVKKKYKVEKAKIAAGAGPSKWRFFDRLDELIGPTAKLNSSAADANNSNHNYHKVPMGIPVGGAIRSSSKPSRKRPPVDSDDESEPENSADSSDGLPPLPQTHKTAPRMIPIRRREMMSKKKSDKEGNWGNSMRELTRAVLRFGEAYEQAETAKLQQLVEMEKQRMKFAKDLELQRMQYFMKTQLELSQLKKNNRRMMTGATNSNHHHHVISNNDNGANNDNDNDNNNNNNDNNSDSSN
ncbi:trihelix transcription factor asil2, partial [Phtheirospermum japonicum]